MDLINVLKSKWWVFALLGILLFSYHIRALNIIPDRILSYDPTFQYRYTSYFAEYGHLPAWDELTYYVGRPIEIYSSPPFMLYLTSVIFWVVGALGPSLLTVSAYMSAVYGAMIVIPAFLLGRELSNKYGGLFSALLIGTAPQILTRTFGSSYDTDQIVLFFLVLTLYVGVYAMRKRNIPSICLAIAGFSLFLLSWGFSMYSLFIIGGFVAIYFILNLFKRNEHGKFNASVLVNNMKDGFSNVLKYIAVFISIVIGVGIFAAINGESIWHHIASVLGFALSAENWIVNISIAELQPFSIFNLSGWIVSMGNFVTGIDLIDMTIMLAFTVFIAMGFLYNYKKKRMFTLSVLAILLIVGVYTTFRGIRFTEFTSALFIIMIGTGFGSLLKMVEKDTVKKTLVLGTALVISMVAISVSMSMGLQLGPDVNPNWDATWEFLRTQTDELSIVGTWWDPGHMISALGERRNYADGAHCGTVCLFNINDRITDLGKIMSTTNETESVELIRKYQGASTESYWIASDDLIGKYRWLQYFGLGCDGTVDSSCPLYIQLGQTSQSTDENGNIVFLNYAMSQTSKLMIYNGQYPIPMFMEGINIAFFEEFIFYDETGPVTIKLSGDDINALVDVMQPLESQLNARFTNQTISMTAWMPDHYQYMVIIPPSLRNTVFTKMFMLEGQGLEHFNQVFRNDQVKIYEIV